MGKKKRSKVVMPWCWYCEREFEDQPTLIIHQRAKHFRCPQPDCKKKYQTFKVMAQHAQTQHDFTVESVPNALPHRNDTTMEICGLNGIPQDDIYGHEKHVLGSSPVKRPCYDEISEDQLRSQVAQFQATGTSGFEHHYPHQKDMNDSVYPFYQSSYPWPGYSFLPVDPSLEASIETPPPPSIESSPHSIEPPPPPPPLEEPQSPPPPPPPPIKRHSGTLSKKRRVSPLVLLKTPMKLIPVFQRTDLSPDEWRALRISNT